MEKWKDIPGYEGLYEASTKGKVRSKEGKVTYSRFHGKRVWKSRVLKEKNQSGRDATHDLWKGGEPKTFLAHRLVALTFIPNVENKPCINHKDGNPRNNNISNLEWVTYKENAHHAVVNGLDGTSVVTLVKDKNSGVTHKFYSMAKASKFMGHNPGYISGLLKRGKCENGSYLIKVVD